MRLCQPTKGDLIMASEFFALHIEWHFLLTVAPRLLSVVTPL